LTLLAHVRGRARRGADPRRGGLGDASPDRVTHSFDLLETAWQDRGNTKTGQIESGDTRRIAMWMLDPDYDGRSFFPRQVFVPMADEGGWLGPPGPEPQGGD
jgi:hypothetical protein